MTWREILKELRSNATVSVPTAGHALAGLTPKAAYAVAQRGALGVPVLSVGGKKRVPSMAVLKKLGLVEGSENEAA